MVFPAFHQVKPIIKIKNNAVLHGCPIFPKHRIVTRSACCFQFNIHRYLADVFVVQSELIEKLNYFCENNLIEIFRGELDE